ACAVTVLGAAPACNQRRSEEQISTTESLPGRVDASRPVLGVVPARIPWQSDGPVASLADVKWEEPHPPGWDPYGKGWTVWCIDQFRGSLRSLRSWRQPVLASGRLRSGRSTDGIEVVSYSLRLPSGETFVAEATGVLSPRQPDQDWNDAVGDSPS